MGESNVNVLSIAALVLAITGLAVGAVLPQAGDLALSDLQETSISNSLNGQALIFNGENWVNGNLTHVPTIQRNMTETFNLNATGLVNVTVTFNSLFEAAPVVTVGLVDVSNSSVVLVNVCATNVSMSGFTCQCLVSTAAEGSAKFCWLAVEA